jgi:hypothetical protein
VSLNNYFWDSRTTRYKQGHLNTPYIGFTQSVALVTETNLKTWLESNSSIAVSKTVVNINGNCEKMRQPLKKLDTVRVPVRYFLQLNTVKEEVKLSI